MDRSGKSSSPRRFFLLPEEPAGGPGQRSRIRRYRLASVGEGAGCWRADADTEIAMARIARELARLGRT
jgi:hypothetical protein